MNPKQFLAAFVAAVLLAMGVPPMAQAHLNCDTRNGYVWHDRPQPWGGSQERCELQGQPTAATATTAAAVTTPNGMSAVLYGGGAIATHSDHKTVETVSADGLTKTTTEESNSGVVAQSACGDACQTKLYNQRVMTGAVAIGVLELVSKLGRR